MHFLSPRSILLLLGSSVVIQALALPPHRSFTSTRDLYHSNIFTVTAKWLTTTMHCTNPALSWSMIGLSLLDRRENHQSQPLRHPNRSLRPGLGRMSFPCHTRKSHGLLTHKTSVISRAIHASMMWFREICPEIFQSQQVRS